MREFKEAFCPTCKMVVASGYDLVKVGRLSAQHAHMVFNRGPDGRAFVDPAHWMYFDRDGDFHFDANKIAETLDVPVEAVAEIVQRAMRDVWPGVKLASNKGGQGKLRP